MAETFFSGTTMFDSEPSLMRDSCQRLERKEKQEEKEQRTAIINYKKQTEVGVSDDGQLRYTRGKTTDISTSYYSRMQTSTKAAHSLGSMYF